MSHLGPETKAIIEAINGLKKPAHENLNYLIVTLDLTVARVNELYELPGWFDFLSVGRMTGTATIRLNKATKDIIDLEYVKTINSPIRRFYITNAAQAGETVVLALGGDASFMGEPLRQDLKVFNYRSLDEDGGLGLFVNSRLETDTPVEQFIWAYRVSLKEGIIKRIHYRLNPTNAVTYTLRIYDRAVAPDYESRLGKLWESAAVQADDTEYDHGELEIPFALPTMGVLFFTIQWTAAPGVTPGFIQVSGVQLK